MDLENETSALCSEVQSMVLQQLGLKISVDDPVFALVLANKLALKSLTKPIIDAVQDIPSVMEVSLEVIASAVEEAEKTAHTLASETKSHLFALQKVQLEESSRSLKDAITQVAREAVSSALERSQAEVVALETRLKTVRVPNSNSGSKALFMVASAILILTILFGAAGYSLFGAAMNNANDARNWQGLYFQQKAQLEKIPPSVKKQYQAN